VGEIGGGLEGASSIKQELPRALSEKRMLLSQTSIKLVEGGNWRGIRCRQQAKDIARLVETSAVHGMLQCSLLGHSLVW